MAPEASICVVWSRAGVAMGEAVYHWVWSTHRSEGTPDAGRIVRQDVLIKAD